jgi:hypothetical protein
MSDTAKFGQHIENLVIKVRQKIGWIFRTFFYKKNIYIETALEEPGAVPH